MCTNTCTHRRPSRNTSSSTRASARILSILLLAAVVAAALLTGCGRVEATSATYVFSPNSPTQAEQITVGNQSLRAGWVQAGVIIYVPVGPTMQSTQVIHPGDGAVQLSDGLTAQVAETSTQVYQLTLTE